MQFKLILDYFSLHASIERCVIIFYFYRMMMRLDVISLTKYNSFHASFKAENFESLSESGLRRRTNEAGERMKPEVVAVKCARGPTWDTHTVSVRKRRCRCGEIKPGPRESRGFPPSRTPLIPLPIVPLPFSSPKVLSVSFFFIVPHRAFSRDGAHRLARIKYSQEF